MQAAKTTSVLCQTTYVQRDTPILHLCTQIPASAAPIRTQNLQVHCTKRRTTVHSSVSDSSPVENRGAHCSRPSGSRKYSQSGKWNPNDLYIYSMFFSNVVLVWLSNRLRLLSQTSHSLACTCPGSCAVLSLSLTAAPASSACIHATETRQHDAVVCVHPARPTATIPQCCGSWSQTEPESCTSQISAAGEPHSEQTFPVLFHPNAPVC